MAKKIDNFLTLINKFIGAFLVLIFATMLTMNNTIGAIDERSKTTKELALLTHSDMTSLKLQVGLISSEQNSKIDSIRMLSENNRNNLHEHGG